jgi:hypothetical protein
MTGGKVVLVRKADVVSREHARLFLGYQPRAHKFYAYDASLHRQRVFWLGRLAGQEVTCHDQEVEHASRTEAIADAKAFLAHMKELVAKPAGARQIMILPSVDGDDHTMAILTPEGMHPTAALDLADQILTSLEEADQKSRFVPGPVDEWTTDTLLEALEAKGFQQLDYFNGPTWDRNGA